MKILNGDRVRVYVRVRMYVCTYFGDHHTKYGQEMRIIYIRIIDHLTPYLQSA